MSFQTLHPVTEPSKVEEIAVSMKSNGWIGAPVVILDDIQITGVHRAAAAEMANIKLETIALADVFAEDGQDWEEALESYEDDIKSGYTLNDALDYLLGELSEDVREKYGIDLH